MIKKVGIVGGDQRTLNLSKLLIDDHFDVSIFGVDRKYADFIPSDCMSDSLEDMVKKCDAVIGPIPFSQDDIFVFTPFYDKAIAIEELLRILAKYKVALITSVIKENTKKLCNILDIKYYDLYEREELAILNAIPTAEGCIMIAIEQMPITLHGSHVMVLGFGRIGKLLSKLLSAFCCDVYVAARKVSDLAMIKAFGSKPVNLPELRNYIGNIDLLINTIPSPIVDKAILDCVKKDVLIIDLASKPGGIDFEYAKRLGIKTIHALSLPGKVAPKTAAEYLKEALYNTFKEMEV